MSNTTITSKRVERIPKSAIHEMTRLSKEIEDVAFLSWAKPTSNAPPHIRDAAIVGHRVCVHMVRSSPVAEPQ